MLKVAAYVRSTIGNAINPSYARRWCLRVSIREENGPICGIDIDRQGLCAE